MLQLSAASAAENGLNQLRRIHQQPSRKLTAKPHAADLELHVSVVSDLEQSFEKSQ